MKTTKSQLQGKSRILKLAAFAALVVANVQPVSAQKSYQIYSLAESFSTNVVGLGGIAANGTLLGYGSFEQGLSALITRGGSILPLAGPAGVVESFYTGINASRAA